MREIERGGEEERQVSGQKWKKKDNTLTDRERERRES